MPVTIGEGASALTLSTLDDLTPPPRRALVRTDYNVPLEAGGVADDSRLVASLPTLRELLDKGAALVLMSHLGRPKGPDEAFRMSPVAARLSELLDRPVQAVPDVAGPDAQKAVAGLGPGEILLLENLRFDPGEKTNDGQLARALGAFGDVYVDDAFGTAHRAAASTVGVTAFLPSFAGRLMERELTTLGEALYRPRRPFVSIFGGAKISDKLGVLHNVAGKCDGILVGGAMANTLLAAEGIAMGDSLFEADRLDDARRLLDAARGKLGLPEDLVLADAFAETASRRVVPATAGVPDGWRALDIGPRTVASFAATLRGARTVVWNGPMGAFEMRPFADGTFKLAEVVAALPDALTIVGGGDSVAALNESGLADRIDWVSTGGGAMLEFMAGAALPAVVALADAHARSSATPAA